MKDIEQQILDGLEEKCLELSYKHHNEITLAIDDLKQFTSKVIKRVKNNILENMLDDLGYSYLLEEENHKEEIKKLIRRYIMKLNIELTGEA